MSDVSKSTSTDLVGGQLSDLDDLHSELHEQRFQDHALVLPVLLAHGLLPLRHTCLENTQSRVRGRFVNDNTANLWESLHKIGFWDQWWRPSFGFPLTSDSEHKDRRRE